MANERSQYAETRMSRTGLPVPVFEDGTAVNSLYDPEREARQIVDGIPAGSFVFFAGIGGGYHIREFLSRFPESSCIVSESGVVSLERLSSIIDIADILSNPHVTVIPDCTDANISDILPRTYLPAIHGNFQLVPLRSWQERNKDAAAILGQLIRQALSGISADFSVQSHFGKLWFRNILLNLRLAAECGYVLPDLSSRGKTAVVAGAGPGLEEMLPALRSDRKRYVIFSTDTAYGTLSAYGIEPEYFVSMDAQSISARHVMPPFSPSTTVILDLCGNPDIAIRARACGAKILYAAGGHPLARYAAREGNLPLIDTSSGTVTLAALDAAHSFGFDDVLLPGADFSYVYGKPYARGTYLEAIYGRDASRVLPMETQYAALIFRTSVTKTLTERGISYSTETLSRYAEACTRASARKGSRWRCGAIDPFPFGKFMEQYLSEVEAVMSSHDRKNPAFSTLLPFVAWYRASCSRQGDKPDFGHAIKLAHDLIARYTLVS